MIFKIESPLILKIYSNELHHTVTKAAKNSVITLLVKKFSLRTITKRLERMMLSNPLIIKEGDNRHIL